MIVPSEKKVFVLPDRYHINYPDKSETLTFLDKETIKLPFRHREIKPTNFQLLHLSTSGVFIETLFEKASLVKNPRSTFGVNYVHISGLDEGRYAIWLKKEDVRINFRVFSGKHWELSTDFLVGERGLIRRVQPSLNLLRIDKVDIKRGDTYSVKVSIGGDY